MNRRELLAGTAAILASDRAEAFGVGRLGLGEGHLGALGRSGMPSYIGQLATGSVIPNASQPQTTFSSNSRGRHIARTAITGLGVAEANWIVSFDSATAASDELLTAGPITVAYGIEYPVGTFTRITWGGAASVTVAAGATAASDVVPIAIPNGAVFFIRRYQTSTSCSVHTTSPGAAAHVSDIANGEAFASSTTSIIADLSVGGTIINYGGNDVIGRPAAIFGPTTAPSFYIWGDSIPKGAADTPSGTSGDLGEIARAIGPYFGYINGGVNGQSANSFSNNLANHARQIALAKAYTSHLLSQMGTNDFANSETAATVEGYLQTCWNAFGYSANRIYQSTIIPETTSSDSFATLANQTVNVGNTNRIAFNDLLRAGSVSGIQGYFEFADAVESSRNSGKWIVNGTANYATADGTHPSAAANLLFANPSIFNGSSVSLTSPPAFIIDEQFTTGVYSPGPITSDIVDTRSTTKFVTNSAGLLSSVAVNALPISNTGMLVEPAATNICLQSGALQTSPWSPSSIVVGLPVVTANATAAPDGTITAAQIAFPAISGAGADATVSTTLALNGSYTWSMYLKGSVGGEVVYILDTPDGTNYLRKACTLTTAWQRFSFSGPQPGAAGTHFFGVGADLRDGSQTSKPAQTIFAWGAQIELGSVATSYIPTTTAAATRGADSATIQRTGIGRLVFIFDDFSGQTISGINTAAQFTLPTNLNRLLIKRMTGYTS
jgi:hypothetical protein